MISMQITNSGNQSKTKFQLNFSITKSQLHLVFPGGLPSKYYPGPMLLNFGDQTRTSAFNMVWQLAVISSQFLVYLFEIGRASCRESVYAFYFKVISKSKIFYDYVLNSIFM